VINTGLDMYLEARKSFYKFEEEEKEMNEKLREMVPKMFKTGNLNTVCISFEAGYWRKANAIHKWFVDNCQRGEDDCREAYVGRNQLIELRDLCNEVLQKSKVEISKVKNGYELTKDGKKKYNYIEARTIKNPEVASELLPTQSGFYFGYTDYDEWYLSDLEDTIEIIDKCLKLPESWEFYYHSSW